MAALLQKITPHTTFVEVELCIMRSMFGLVFCNYFKMHICLIFYIFLKVLNLKTASSLIFFSVF